MSRDSRIWSWRLIQILEWIQHWNPARKSQPDFHLPKTVRKAEPNRVGLNQSYQDRSRGLGGEWQRLGYSWRWFQQAFFIYLFWLWVERKVLRRWGWLILFFFPFIFISWRLITLQYCSGFCHTLTWISHGFTCVPHSEPPSRLPPIPSLCVFPVHQPWALVSCIQPGLVICFTLDNIHVSMLFSQIIPPSPSPTESKCLFCTSVSLFLSCI